MKFALMKNVCPACGEGLFSNSEMKDIGMLKNRIIQQGFGKSYSEVQAFEVALYVMDEIKNGIGQKYFQGFLNKKNGSVSEEESEESVQEKLRKEVESEYPELQNLPAENISSPSPESFIPEVEPSHTPIEDAEFGEVTLETTRSQRVERLKRAAEKSKKSYLSKKNPGFSVRRV